MRIIFSDTKIFPGWCGAQRYFMTVASLQGRTGLNSRMPGIKGVHEKYIALHKIPFQMIKRQTSRQTANTHIFVIDTGIEKYLHGTYNTCNTSAYNHVNVFLLNNFQSKNIVNCCLAKKCPKGYSISFKCNIKRIHDLCPRFPHLITM